MFCLEQDCLETNYTAVQMEYLGTQVNNGTVDATNGCVRGYDNAGKGLGLIESHWVPFLLFLSFSFLVNGQDS